MIARAPFGSTGHQSSRVIFGAAALGAMSQARADATLELVRGAGLNHIDTAADYGDAELRLAPWLAEHRSEVFLATKTGRRSGEAARAELERSLERMGVDQVDLIQLHNLAETDEWEQAFADDGVVAAMDAARAEGLVCHIGVTGHGMGIAAMHQRSLEAFAFDSVLLPYSPVLLADETYRSDVDTLRATCRERGVAIQTIKAIARRRWRDDDPSRRFSWYEPVRSTAAIDRMMRYVLAEEDLFLNTTSDATLLPAVLDSAERCGDRPISPPSDAEVAADLADHDIEPIFDRGDLATI